MATTTAERLAQTARVANETANERSRAAAEYSAVMDAARTTKVSAADLNRIRTQHEIACIRDDEARADHAAAESAHRATTNSDLLDQAAPIVAEQDRALWEKLQALESAASELLHAYNVRTSTIANLVGTLGNSVASSSTRFTQGPEGPRLDGRLIHIRRPEVSASVLAAVAPLVYLGNATAGDQMAEAARVSTKLPAPR